MSPIHCISAHQSQSQFQYMSLSIHWHCILDDIPPFILLLTEATCKFLHWESCHERAARCLRLNWILSTHVNTWWRRSHFAYKSAIHCIKKQPHWWLATKDSDHHRRPATDCWLIITKLNRICNTFAFNGPIEWKSCKNQSSNRGFISCSNERGSRFELESKHPRCRKLSGSGREEEWFHLQTKQDL